MILIRSVAAFFVLAGTVAACSAAPVASESQDESTSAFTRAPRPGPPIPAPLEVRNLCAPDMPPGRILAAMPDWSCPTIPVTGGWLVGIDGRTWFASESAVHASAMARIAPTLTSAMLYGQQPYCVYDYKTTLDACQYGKNQQYGRGVYSAGATDAGFLCVLLDHPCPGSGGCPSCKPAPPIY